MVTLESPPQFHAPMRTSNPRNQKPDKMKISKDVASSEGRKRQMGELHLYVVDCDVTSTIEMYGMVECYSEKIDFLNTAHHSNHART